MTLRMAALGLVVVAWVAAGGCTTVTTDGGTGTAGCPTAEPGLGAACTKVGQVCDYAVSPAGGEPCTATYICDDKLERWRFEDTTCPPDDCLHALDGTFCAMPGNSCDLHQECSAFTTTCSGEHVWVTTNYVGSVGGYPCPCAKMADEASCEATSGCRWLWPGCDMPSLPAAGCYPTAHCKPGWCVDPGTTCQTVSHDPCHGKSCDSCGASVSLCLP